jgi:hypothetical protein
LVLVEVGENSQPRLFFYGDVQEAFDDVEALYFGAIGLKGFPDFVGRSFGIELGDLEKREYHKRECSLKFLSGRLKIYFAFGSLMPKKLEECLLDLGYYFFL